MTVLKRSIQDYSCNMKLPLIVLPEKSNTQNAYILLRKQLGDGPEIKIPSEPDVWIEAALDADQNGSWHQLRKDELKNIALCLCYNKENRLIDNKPLLNSFLSVCEKHKRKSLIRALIWVYLFQYQKNDEALSLLGTWLSEKVKHWDWHWKDREKSFKIFSNHSAPKSIAEAVLKLNQSIPIVLGSCGVGGNLQSGGMASAAFEEVLKKFTQQANSKDSETTKEHLKRIFSWSLLEERQFSYPKLKTLLIDSLLLPWIENKPEEKVKDLIQSFLIENFDDPRIKRNNWLGVHEEALRIIRSWLVERALAQFLDVVDDLALDKQWKYRRAFWTAYYNRDVIDDAWVAFAANGIGRVRQIARRHNDNTWLSFGKLEGSGDPNHAVLILKIGDLTIADFSHNGKCRIWNTDNDNAPKPYNTHYNRSDLMHANSNSEFIHSSSDRGTWQRNVAGEIFSKTGVRLSYGDYMP